MSVYEVIGLILGSNIALEFVKQIFSRNQNKASANKTKSEAATIILQGELKVTEFYKEQLENIMLKHQQLEQRLKLKEEENLILKDKFDAMEATNRELRREVTLLKLRCDEIEKK